MPVTFWALGDKSAGWMTNRQGKPHFAVKFAFFAG
jgi:hypothetical protein